MDKSNENYSKMVNFKMLLPQIYASCVSTAFNIHLSSALSFSTFVIPQLEDENSDIKVTISQSSWTATILSVMITVSVLFNGFFIDKLGIINTLKISAFPGVLGWILVATATNIYVLLFGRFLIGISVGMGMGCTVYVTEITRPDIRGSLLITIPTFVSIGLLVNNSIGYFVHWRTLAWINNIYILVPSILTISLPESPVWLIYKGRLTQAKKALKWFNKLHPNCEEETDKQFTELVENNKKKTLANMDSTLNFKQILMSFTKPTGFKPLLLATGLFVFQQFSGIYIILFHTIIFFRSINSGIDENMVPIIFGIVRFLMSMTTIILMKYFNKRTLIIASSTGMVIFMIISALFTLWIQQGTTSYKLVPLCSIILFIISAMLGMIPVPWMSTSEIFPTNIRGFGNGISTAIGNGLMSIALQNYRYLELYLGGSYAIQFFFASFSIGSLIFVYLFMPETRNKKLFEIEEYFENNWIYFARKKTNKKIEEKFEFHELNIQK